MYALPRNTIARTMLGLLVLLIAGVAAYWPALGAGYIWDDDSYLTQNPIITDPAGLSKIWSSLTATPQFYPLVFSSFWIEHHLWGLEPLGYHAINVVAHVLTSFLVWIGLRRLGVRGAFLAALIFAVHPVHVESVAWVTERKNTFSGLFTAASMVCYLRFAALDGVARASAASRVGAYAAALGLFALALLSKTVACSLPAAIVLVLWWKRERWRWLDVVPLLPMFAMGLAGAMVTTWVEHHHVAVKYVDLGLSPAGRVLVAGRAAWFYLGKLAAPIDLTFIYPRWEVDTGVWWQWLFPGAGAALIVALWALRARIGKGPLVGVLYFVGTLVPALGFIDVYPMRYSFVADHFQYMASLGPITLIAWGVSRLVEPRKGAGSSRLPIVGAAAFVALASLTARQCLIYKDAETLWRDTIAKNDAAWMAHNNLGAILISSGRIDEGEQHLLRSIELHPDHAEALNNLAVLALNRNDPARAADFSRRAIAADRRKVEAYLVGVRAMLKLNKADQALEWSRAAVEIAPEAGVTQQTLGAVLMRLERTGEAEKPLREALKLGIDDPATMGALSQALADRGEFKEAGEVAKRALERAPRTYSALWVSGYSKAMLAPSDASAVESGVATLRQVIALYPNAPEAYVALSSILAARADGREEAITLAEAAVEKNPESPRARRHLSRLRAGDK